MGSPESEEGRWDDEGPPHEVSIATGFWIFDTPCTHALWEVVMGTNPSQFKGPDRPVETVSWDDCQEFVRRVNERLVGLKLGLPSEAQWEYACRAGSDAAR
jgi:formylglycine-generating enzyme required for sulfatase activity